MAHHRLWQFRPPSGRAEPFARAYAADGPWAQLFARALGFRATRLLPPAEPDGWWLTIDSWDSADAFERFKAEFRDAYDALDRELAGVAGEEHFVGAFDDT